VIQEAIVAQAGAAIVTIKLLAMVNLVSAFAAFYGSIDKLKHLTLVSRDRLLITPALGNLT